MRNFVVAKLLLALIFYPEVHGQSEYVDEGSPRPQGEVGLLNTDEGQYNEVTAQHWINLQENPLDLNQITKEELLSLSLLSVSQINNFLRYVKIHGRLISIYELQAIPEFDVATIRKILPMVAVRPAINHYAGQKLTKRISRADNHYLVLRVNKTLEKKSGFDKGRQSRFAGSPYHWLIKYRSSHSKDFSLGFTMEKDPGERFAWQLRDHQPGPDFWSWHFTLRNRGNLKNLTLGDYKLQLGQGILFAAGFYPGKGSETITTIRRSNLGIVPHTSTAENGFLRGGAMTYQIRPVTLTVFYSNKMIDDNLKFDSLSSSLLVSSIKESGLHRTASEISQRKSLHEQVGGVNITYLSKDKNLNLGQILSFTKYNLAAFKSDNLYKKFTNNDKLTMYAGYNFSYNWENFHFFG